jgi:hypothetical protein
MSKGKDKKPKADKSKPKTGVSPYKAAQGIGKPAISPLAKKPGGSQIGREAWIFPLTASRLKSAAPLTPIFSFPVRRRSATRGRC